MIMMRAFSACEGCVCRLCMLDVKRRQVLTGGQSRLNIKPGFTPRPPLFLFYLFADFKSGAATFLFFLFFEDANKKEGFREGGCSA